MENANKNVLITIVAVLAVLILIGAYVLFQNKPALPTPEGPIATSTVATTTTTATGASGAMHTGAGTPLITTTEGGNGQFGIIADTSHVTIGATLPKIIVNLPANANGKTLVIALKPAAQKTGIPQEIMLAATIDTTGDTYDISGLRVGTTSNATTGAKTAVTPGIYQIEAVLWDKNPFMTGGIYGNNAGNNATAVVTSMFTVSAAQ